LKKTSFVSDESAKHDPEESCSDSFTYHFSYHLALIWDYGLTSARESLDFQQVQVFL